jgi:hypothetical protein
MKIPFQITNGINGSHEYIVTNENEAELTICGDVTIILPNMCKLHDTIFTLSFEDDVCIFTDLDKPIPVSMLKLFLRYMGSLTDTDSNLFQINDHDHIHIRTEKTMNETLPLPLYIFEQGINNMPNTVLQNNVEYKKTVLNNGSILIQPTTYTASATGDPYIKTFLSDNTSKNTNIEYMYKLPGKTCIYRLFDNGTLFINTSVGSLNYDERKRIRTVYKNNNVTDDGFFFDSFYINNSSTGTYIMFDRYLRILDHNIPIHNVKTYLQYDKTVYTESCTMLGALSFLRIYINIAPNVRIELRRYIHCPQVINGIHIHLQGQILANVNGIVNSIDHPKHFILKHIKSCSPLSSRERKCYKKVITDKFTTQNIPSKI